MFVISCTNIWPNFILILPGIIKTIEIIYLYSNFTELALWQQIYTLHRKILFMSLYLVRSLFLWRIACGHTIHPPFWENCYPLLLNLHYSEIFLLSSYVIYVHATTLGQNANFEVCRFSKNKNLNILRTKHYFSFKQKKIIYHKLRALIWQKWFSSGCSL